MLYICYIFSNSKLLSLGSFLNSWQTLVMFGYLREVRKGSEEGQMMVRWSEVKVKLKSSNQGQVRVRGKSDDGEIVR